MTELALNISHRRWISTINVNTVLSSDPSRTIMLRRQFVAQMNRRFRALKVDIRISIVDDDCFGIQPDVFRILASAGQKAFEFVRTPQKVSMFMDWLEKQEDVGILQKVIRPGAIGVESAWSDVYIDSAYAKGMRRGRTELQRAGYPVPTFEQTPGGLAGTMNQPIHADRIGIIYSRTFEDLKSVTQAMNAQVRRKIADGLTVGLARGLAEGKNPRVIARELYKNVADRVDKIGITRARMIARTEVLNAHNEALMAQYEQAEKDIGRPVMVDVSTGANPCDICVGLAASGPYPLAEARGMLPAHPNCVCVHIPVGKGRTK